MNAYFPRHVENVLNSLRGNIGRYVFCSTVSAYQATLLTKPTCEIHEDFPLRTCSPEQAIDTNHTFYGERKAECERVIRAQSRIPVVIIRPSVVFGAYDYTERMAHWLWRGSRKIPFILPEGGVRITQRTYAPDLGQAFLSAVTSPRALGQSYNIVEETPLNFRETLAIIGKSQGIDALKYAIPISAQQLLQQKIQPWLDFPFWWPGNDLLFSSAKSIEDLQLKCTSPEIALAEATRAFLTEGREPIAGIRPSLEAELIKKFS